MQQTILRKVLQSQSRPLLGPASAFTLQNISRYYAKWVPYAMIIRDGLIIIKIFALASKFHVNLHELTPNQHSVIDSLVGNNAGNDCENFAQVRETKP